MFKTFKQLADLLRPFRKQFYLYLIMIFFYESAQVVNSYVLTGAIRLYQNHSSINLWIMCFAGLFLFDQSFRFLDHALDWKILSRLLFPITKHINMMVAKIFLTQDTSVIRLKSSTLVSMLLSCRFLLRRWRCRARTGLSLSGWRAAGTAAWRSAP